MEYSLRAQLNIIKTMDLKPNFSESTRKYNLDRRIVNKYYEGYERKPKTRDKSSKLDKYKDEIIKKLQIEGIRVKGIYEYFLFIHILTFTDAKGKIQMSIEDN